MHQGIYRRAIIFEYIATGTYRTKCILYNQTREIKILSVCALNEATDFWIRLDFPKYLQKFFCLKYSL